MKKQIVLSSALLFNIFSLYTMIYNANTDPDPEYIKKYGVYSFSIEPNGDLIEKWVTELPNLTWLGREWHKKNIELNQRTNNISRAVVTTAISHIETSKAKIFNAITIFSVVQVLGLLTWIYISY